MDGTMTENLTEEQTRLQKANDLRQQGKNPYAYSYKKSHTIQQIYDTYGSLEIGDENNDVISIAGRLVAKRGHGKASFGNLLDETNKLQYYAAINLMGEEDYKSLLNLDIGDIIGLEGVPFRTKKGELSIKITRYTLLSKALLPLPEKYHGLQDKELRYRQRYVDLIANTSVRETFKMRSHIIKFIRDSLHQDGFMEVETPVLHNIYGGAAAKPFSTHHNELDQDLYLRIALELHLKRLVVGGFEKIFEIGRVFRNEGVSFKHNPEYTLLELYQAYVDYNDMMVLTETLLSRLVKSLHGSYTLEYQDKMLNFEPPFKRLTLEDALKTYANVDINGDDDYLRKEAKQLGLDTSQKPLRGQVINYIYDKAVEHHLIQPTFITDYPWETSPLAKKHRDKPGMVERFELIVNTMELANAFSELTDPIDQKERFDEQLKQKAAGCEDAHEMDNDYIEALKYGLPPTGGLGIGIDRIVMLLCNEASIRDVLFFPHMRDK